MTDYNVMREERAKYIVLRQNVLLSHNRFVSLSMMQDLFIICMVRNELLPVPRARRCHTLRCRPSDNQYVNTCSDPE